MRTSLSLVMAFLVILAGCKNENELVTAVVPTNEEIVIQNAYLVRDAAEAFAADNSNVYPTQDYQLLPYLPNGEPLLNPYTGFQSEPRNGSIPLDSGEISYISVDDSTGVPAGYHIRGAGDSVPVGVNLVIEISKTP
jgi:hypothetical protein